MAEDIRATGKLRLQLCYNAIVDKKAEEVAILDLRSLSSVADFFVICHGSSTRQVAAISDNIEKSLRQTGIKDYRVEGKQEGSWILVDACDIVVHVFQERVREYYSLESIWADARRIDCGEIEKWGENLG